MTFARKKTGKAGEEAAYQFLSRRGWAVLERNYVCPLGELDLIARDDDALVFVEVRARTSVSFGTPQESITPTKKRKLRQLAWYYLKATNQPNANCRFDVIAVKINRQTGQVTNIEHLINAF